jgi:hypothetical protein
LKITWIEYPFLSNGEVSNKGDTIELEYLNNKNVVIKRIIRDKTKLGILEKTTIYDLNGKLKTTIVNYDGKHVYHTDMTKDQAGYINELKIYEVGDKDTAVAVFVYEFNQDSSIVYSKQINKTDSAVIAYYEYKYDAQKRLVQLTTKTPSEKGIIIESIESYAYDAKGNKLSYEKQNLTDSITSKAIFMYNEANNLVREVNYNNGTLMNQVDYKYEADKKKEAIKNIPSLKNMSKIEFVYNYE